MGLNVIQICSQALLKIGANPISSFEDGTAEADVAANLFPIVRDSLLSAHPWNFAISQRNLPRLAASPIADYDEAFQLPEDCLRIVSAGENGAGRGLQFSVQGQTLLANADSVTLTYVARVSEERFPAFFIVALLARLASEFCIPLTDSTTRWKALLDVSEEELRRARLIDSQEQSPSALEDFPLLQGRY